MLPFLVNMSHLYELFVSEWLKAHLPDVISLVPQERAYLDDTSGLYFDIDLVLRDTSTGEILSVLDTKYKDTTTPATDDIAQIVAYAEKMGCQGPYWFTPVVYPGPSTHGWVTSGCGPCPSPLRGMWTKRVIASCARCWRTHWSRRKR